ncbi:helix-turn-helix transcriptional regulator [Brachybacterium halotolerans subsp. kimchii]|uniref:Helix-turn-helix transcriptional regulator n=1 Tax=Brachybacterium halotolerans TaxID=2795215 RepID=A0ABS1B7P5_9MICO|nr:MULTISPECIES: helix-turn-helix transcriptional regulator [Brachybacterium]MBK0330665.1 helix-turn-helix transcriptional regulator [Brachybacterium halotolerans]MCG7308782.1 helix-turn-helix transcriptional regulator [Brachybacterium sp. ACRRE]UEJ83541.1 helix-turn-helix transcriptional regulator [Brachybacterium halotolerans subsp. kimchii]
MPPFQQIDERAPVFVISVAAELAGMHPQTLRQYDRLGLVSPQRTSGRGRRYSARDVAQLREVQRLSQEEGINLAGIKRILELQDEVTQLQSQLGSVREAIAAMGGRASGARSSGGGENSGRVFAADSAGRVSTLRRGQRPARPDSGAVVLWRPGGGR